MLEIRELLGSLDQTKPEPEFEELARQPFPYSGHKRKRDAGEWVHYSLGN